MTFPWRDQPAALLEQHFNPRVAVPSLQKALKCCRVISLQAPLYLLIHPSLCASTHTGLPSPIARGMSLDYHDVHPGIPHANMGISSLFPLCTAVPGTPRPSLPGTQRRWACPPALEPGTGRRCHVPEPSHRQLSQEHPHACAIGIHDVRTGPSHADELGERGLLRTDRGDIQAILHQAP